MSHVRSLLVVYGGKENGAAFCNRIFLLRYTENPMIWEEVTANDVTGSPMGRWGHSALVVENVPATPPWSLVHRGGSGGEGVLFFGGMAESGALDELLFFNPFARTWTHLEVCPCSCKVLPPWTWALGVLHRKLLGMASTSPPRHVCLCLGS